MLDTLITVARSAGRLLLEQQDARHTTKADGSPVTGADLQADQLIRSSLLETWPQIPCISEESEAPPYEDRKSWDRFWLVDALDGTKEFIAGRDDFTVNIALIEKGRPVAGVVFAPAKGLLYFSSIESGSWKQEQAEPPRRICVRERESDTELTIVESRSHPSDELEQFLSTLPPVKRIQVGSSLKFCLVAEGLADLYPRFGPTMEWDVAAGDCVYRYASIGSPNPSPLTYNKETLRNGSFIIGLNINVS